MLPAEQIREVRVAARQAAQDKIEEVEATRTRNIYKDIEAIESRLDDRIDGLEARSDAAIKSLTKVLAEELGTFCRREIHAQIDGHAADWQEAMDNYDNKLTELHERLDSARERGTGGVQDCFKALDALKEDVRQKTRNLVRSMDTSDRLRGELVIQLNDLRSEFDAHEMDEARHVERGQTRITQGGRMESRYVGPKHLTPKYIVERLGKLADDRENAGYAELANELNFARSLIQQAFNV